MRQFALNQQVNLVHQTARICGIYSSIEHHANLCPQLQETSHSSMEMVAGVFQGQAGVYKPLQQQPYNPFSNIYNPGWRDHPNLRYEPVQPAKTKHIRIIFSNSFSLL